jgi:hypothetical protein
MNNNIINLLNNKISDLDKECKRVKEYNSSLLAKLKYYISEDEADTLKLETVIKARKLFEDNVFKFGYLDVIEHTIKDLLKWERELKEQDND